MAHRTAVILVVGLTERELAHMPRVRGFRERGHLCRLTPCLPAVTCSVQSSMLTGLAPREHGIVGNGWYDRESAEVRFWKQSNRLVHGEKVWETARERDASVTWRADVLVVQHVLVGGLVGHAATDVQG